MNLFENGVLYPALACIGCSIFYAGLFNFGFSKIVERLYAFLSGSMVYKVQAYVFLINIPVIIMILTGVIYNACLLSLDVALKIDEIYILAVSSYICYLQQSRHTPLRGFVIIKDTVIIIICLLLYLIVSIGDQMFSFYIITIIFLYLFGLILQSFTNELESWILLALGIRQKNIYSADFLLTEKSHPSNFLEIKDIIAEHPEEIQEEIEDFVCVAQGLKKSNQDLLILTNFAKLFIPIKKAYEIHEIIAKNKIEERFVQSWNELKEDVANEVDNYVEQQQNDKNNSFNHSASSLLIKKTITTDSFFDGDDILEKKDQEQSSLNLAIKYICYPLFLTTHITGRLRYFIDYLILLLLGGVMFVLANAVSFFSVQFPNNHNLISLIFSLLLFYPVSSYFIRISEGSNDYDFLGIFMQGVICKYVILAIALIVRGVMFEQVQMPGDSATVVSLALRIGTYTLLGVYLIWKRFAMRFSNIKAFLSILIVSELAKIASQTIIGQLS